ncbi:DUF6444 domain-containing protein [Synechococcus sp. Cruz CV-v-12]|uniref:DUF6444 domain-containing protein n=1 Tax=unclassified Synechococcus TaxID=2626047 RepID=UPI0037DA7617
MAPPPSLQALVEHLFGQLEALALLVTQFEEQKGRSSRNSSQPHSSDGRGFKPSRTDQGKGTGRKRVGQRGHPGHGPELLPSSNARRCFPTISRAAEAQVSLFQVKILSRCATRWLRSLNLVRL